MPNLRGTTVVLADAVGIPESGGVSGRIGRPCVQRGVVARAEIETLSRAGLVTTDGNRWSRPGEPTIYLGSDIGVALAEFARHFEPGSPPVARIWTVDVRLDGVVDLRDPDVRTNAGIPETRDWSLDREYCQSLATSFRRAGARGLTVPSVAFLDRPECWNLVVFADKLESMEGSIAEPRPCASLGPDGVSR